MSGNWGGGQHHGPAKMSRNFFHLNIMMSDVPESPSSIFPHLIINIGDRCTIFILRPMKRYLSLVEKKKKKIRLLLVSDGTFSNLLYRDTAVIYMTFKKALFHVPGLVGTVYEIPQGSSIEQVSVSELSVWLVCFGSDRLAVQSGLSLLNRGLGSFTVWCISHEFVPVRLYAADKMIEFHRRTVTGLKNWSKCMVTSANSISFFYS